jgi:hypothetical protein
MPRRPKNPEAVMYWQALPCPCGSGARSADCCLDGNLRWKPPLSVGRLPRERGTGHQHPGCYARGLAGCSTKLSREHYVSRCILEQFKDLRVHGFKWATEETSVTPDMLQAKILCERHNGGLSPLDSLAGRLFHFLAQCVDRSLGPPPPVALFNGHDVERVLLKILIDLVAGRAMSTRTTTPRGWVPPLDWLDRLYGGTCWPEDEGLWSSALEANVRASSRFFQLGTYTNVADIPAGMHFVLIGFMGTIALGPLEGPDEYLTHPKRDRAMRRYRPGSYTIRTSDGDRMLALGWDDDRDSHPSIKIDVADGHQ